MADATGDSEAAMVVVKEEPLEETGDLGPPIEVAAEERDAAEHPAHAEEDTLMSVMVVDDQQEQQQLQQGAVDDGDGAPPHASTPPEQPAAPEAPAAPADAADGVHVPILDALPVLAPQRAPQPFSADDVNPECWKPVVTSWLLPPSFALAQRQQQDTHHVDRQRRRSGSEEGANGAAGAAAVWRPQGPNATTEDRQVAMAAAAWLPDEYRQQAAPAQNGDAAAPPGDAAGDQAVKEWGAAHLQAGGGAAAAAAAPGVARPTVDVGKLTPQQLLAAAARHNEQRNVPANPVAVALAGALTALPPLDWALRAYPQTLGGQPANNPFARTWKRFARQVSRSSAAAGGGGGGEDGHAPGGRGGGPARGGRGGQQHQQQQAQQQHAPSSQPPAQPQAQPRSSSSPPPPPAGGVSVSGGGPPSLYPRHVSKEQAEFNLALAVWLDVADLQVPLLAPGAPPLDLKALLVRVGGAGGYRHLGQGGWEELAERLQGRRDVWQALMQAYAFYLLPVEQAMTLADARRSGALEWLHSKATERKALAYCEAGVRPTPGAVSRAAHAAQQALGAWSRAHGAASAHRDVPRLALRLAREVAKDPVAWASGELLLSTHSSGVQVKEEQVEEEGQALGAQQVAGGGDVAPRHPRTLLNAAGEVAYVLVEGGGDVAADGEAARREEVVEAGAMDVDAGGGGEGAAASGEQQVQGQAEHDAAGDTGGEARRAAERVDGLPQLLPPPRQAAAGGGGEGAGGAVEPLPAGVSLEQAQACQALLLSWRQSHSAPPGCLYRPPDLAAHFAWRYEQDTGRPFSGGPGGGAGAGADWAAWGDGGAADAGGGAAARRGPLHAAPDAPREVLPPTRRFLGLTPRCNNCKTCSNPAFRKACEVNRRNLKEGKDPVVWDADANAFVPMQ